MVLSEVPQQDIAALGAAELAAGLSSGELTARHVVDALIARIERVDTALNAVVVRRFDQARAEAAVADAARAEGRPLGPLHGVPMTLKDPFLLAGTASTLGFTWRRDHHADHDGPLVSALRSSGAIILGKTNLSQAMTFTEADNPVYGLTRNPWNLARSPGGSSGGEAAIIEAGGSPLGLGTDTGGSIRFPAHWCGIAGLKPTGGRLTMQDLPSGVARPPLEGLFAQPGPMARNVADLHLAMTVLAPASVGMPDTAPDAPPYPTQLPDVPGMRVGIQLDDSFFRSAPAARRALREAAADLEAAGATMVEFAPPPLAAAPRLMLAVMTSDGGEWVRSSLRGDAPDPRVGGLLRAAALPNRVRHLLVATLRLGAQRHMAFILAAVGRSPGAALERLVADITEYRAAYSRAMDANRVDVVLSPPHALPALRHGGSQYLNVANAGAYATLYNILGLPAGVVPVTKVRAGEESDRPWSLDVVERAALKMERGSAGLPVGVQVAGRSWREDQVLAAMTAIERAVRKRSAVTLVGEGKAR